MSKEIRKRIEEDFSKYTEGKYFQKWQIEKFNSIMDDFSNLDDYESLYVEYLDITGTIYYTFNVGHKIVFEMGFYSNGDIVHSIKVGGEIYRIGDDIGVKEMVSKINNILEDIED